MSNSAFQVSERTSLPQTDLHNQIRLLSDRLVQAQRPLRILEAIQWQPEIEEQFFAKDGRELPPVTRNTYDANPLPFERRAKLRDLRDLERDIVRQLGHANACSQMMVRRCRDYRQVVELLANRGTPKFAAISQELFGSSAWTSRTHAADLCAVGRLVRQVGYAPGRG